MVAQSNFAISFDVLLIIFTIAATCATAGFALGYSIGKNAKNNCPNLSSNDGQLSYITTRS